MKTRTIACEELKLSVMVSEATPFVELRRQLLAKRALTEVATDFGLRPGEPFPEEVQCMSKALLAGYVYPNCLAAVVWSRGFDHHTVSLDEFGAFAEPFVLVWLACVLELNPTWQGVFLGPMQFTKHTQLPF